MWFKSMSTLSIIYLAGNPLYDIDPSMIGLFPAEIVIHSDLPNMCCLSKTFTSCSSISNHSNVCSRLLEHAWLNATFFIIGGLVTVSNGFVAVLRWKTKIDNLHKFGLFTMAVADFGNGVHMLILAAADWHYGAIYPFSDTQWRAHPL